MSAPDPDPVREARLDEAFAITVRSGRLWLPFDEFHQRAERLLDRPIPTREFSRTSVWIELAAAVIARDGEWHPCGVGECPRCGHCWVERVPAA